MDDKVRLKVGDEVIVKRAYFNPDDLEGIADYATFVVKEVFEIAGGWDPDDGYMPEFVKIGFSGFVSERWFDSRSLSRLNVKYPSMI